VEAGQRPRQRLGLARRRGAGGWEPSTTCHARSGRSGISDVANSQQQARLMVGCGLLGFVPWCSSPAQGCSAACRCFSAGRSRAGEGREERGREKKKGQDSNKIFSKF
jgi:hypothetical protein